MTLSMSTTLRHRRRATSTPREGQRRTSCPLWPVPRRGTEHNGERLKSMPPFSFSFIFLVFFFIFRRPFSFSFILLVFFFYLDVQFSYLLFSFFYLDVRFLIYFSRFLFHIQTSVYFPRFLIQIYLTSLGSFCFNSSLCWAVHHVICFPIIILPSSSSQFPFCISSIFPYYFSALLNLPFFSFLPFPLHLFLSSPSFPSFHLPLPHFHFPFTSPFPSPPCLS